MCSYVNVETVVKDLGNYNAGNEQQTEVKYICVKFVDSPEVLQDNRSINAIVRNNIAR
jgi:hypothetical protein